MGKTFISADNVEAFICKADQAFYVDKGMVLTPGAKDRLKTMGISMIYGPRPEAECAAAVENTTPVDAGALEALVGRITRLLKDQYQITDAGTMTTVVARVVETLQKK